MMPFADLGSLRLHYEIDGEGPPLVLLAGMMSDSASWGPVVPELSRSFTVIRPDNRTTGRTEPRKGPVTLDRWVGDVIALMDFLELGRAHVAGHSLGGIMALHLAATAPQRLDRLALLAAAPLFLQRNLFFFRHLLSLRGEGHSPDLWLRGLYPWLFHPRAFDDAAMVETLITLSLSYPHAQGTGAFAAQIDGYAGAETALVLPAALPPTCAILARDDLIMPMSEARRALDRLGPVDVVEVANAGHSVHWDAPGAVVAALLSHFGGRA
jgi:pimeloyl-ACP methyl ester carboxylesterase